MQQVGGAIGLAALSTVAVHFTRGKAAEISGSLSGGSGPAPTGDMKQRIADLVGQGAFTSGATHAFLGGAFMIWTASAIVWIFLNVKHHEIVDDEVPEGVVV